MKNKTALLFGATGLTGSHLLEKLIADQRYKKIKVFSRSAIQSDSVKTEVIITPLEEIEKYEKEIKGDDVFCCLGTTIKKAGSKDNFRKVDYDFPLKIAGIASKNKVPSFLVISSVGADPESRGFYLRTKGEMEKKLYEIGFKKLVILRPSMLLGKREEFRFLEETAKLLIKPAGFMFRGKLRKYRPIEAETLAAAMVNLANTDTGKIFFESHEIELQLKE